MGISFPDLLLSKGEYQLKPGAPFTLGVDFAGRRALAPEGSGFEPGRPGRRVRAATAAPPTSSASVPTASFPLPDALSFEQGAAIPMNYLTAHFALAERGHLQEGETVLVHGAAGGVGTATIQVAKGYGARTIAVVSTDEKARGRAAGRGRRGRAGRRVPRRRQGAHRRAGVDVVMDVVGGDLFTDSLRSLGTQGRLLVVGFAAGRASPR